MGTRGTLKWVSYAHNPPGAQKQKISNTEPHTQDSPGSATETYHNMIDNNFEIPLHNVTITARYLDVIHVIPSTANINFM